MNKTGILYNWLLGVLAHIAGSDTTSQYVTTLVGTPSEGIFISYLERLQIFQDELQAASSSSVHYTRWEDLLACIVAFETSFGNFPGVLFPNVKIVLVLALLVSDPDPIDSNVIDISLFEMRTIELSIECPCFSHENRSSKIESLAVLDSKDLVQLSEALSEHVISLDFVYQIIYAIESYHRLIQHHAVILGVGNSAISDASVESFIKFCIIMSGKNIHVIPRHLAKPLVINTDMLKVSNDYQQWDDVLYVLSEYNCREDITIKYLTLYHVYENLMVKRQLVILERQNAGKSISIRDFRRLYSTTDTDEASALKELFTIMETITVPGTVAVPFIKHVAKRWTQLQRVATVAEIEHALAQLSITSRFNEFNVSTMPKLLPKLVYQMRNAIAHNKETEFHLTFANLSKALKAIMQEFLIPTLEEFCFELIGNKNSLVWYLSDHIQLYRKH